MDFTSRVLVLRLIPSRPLIPVHLFFLAVNINGATVSLPSGSSSYAAIDTGTTLVGGPTEYISEIFAQIPGSAAGTGDFQGYYTYRKILSLSMDHGLMFFFFLH